MLVYEILIRDARYHEPKLLLASSLQLYIVWRQSNHQVVELTQEDKF